MDDAVLVRMGKRASKLCTELAHHVDWQASWRDDLGQRWSIDELHDEHGPVFVFDDVVQRANVRMIERRNSARLLTESPQRFGILHQLGREEFQRDVAAEATVTGAVHVTHTARTNRGQNLVGAEAGAGNEGHRC